MSYDEVSVQQPTATSTEPVSNGNAMPVLSHRQKKMMKRQQKMFTQAQARWVAQRDRFRRKLKNEVAAIKKALAPEDFKNLKDICTINTPEQKGPDGAVIQKASSTVNYRALVVEGRQALVLQRQDRIEKGLRKKTTGRASKRKAHRSALAHVNLRTQQTLATENVK